ncbi:PREDICTED: heterogeneous nuclear ribonucleoprotein U-like, partial [Papilio polytes]|uniref:heterogeneous nuclear ribonucleoprotein U-like n=1 Tax=Papilio polytes TaxID=76194 RepID=UPI000675E6DB
MDPAKMKVVDLRSELGALGLDTKGNKAALVERLKKALEAKTDKVFPDTSIMDTTTEEIDEPETPRKTSPAARVTRRSSTSRLATPAKPVREDSPEPIEEDTKTESEVPKDPEPEVAKEESPKKVEPPPIEESPKKPDVEDIKEVVNEEESKSEEMDQDDQLKEEVNTPELYEPESPKDDSNDGEGQQEKLEVEEKEQKMDHDGEEESASRDRRVSEEGRERDFELTEEEEWALLNERLLIREQERLERERKQAEEDAKKFEEFSKDPIKLQRLKRKQEKKARWSNFYKTVAVTNEVLTPPIEEEEKLLRKVETATKAPEPEVNDDKVTLSWYDSDLNQFLELPELNCVVPMNEGALAHAWAGCRATHGVNAGRVCFEVRVGTVVTTTEAGEKEVISNGLRVGWSTDDSNLHLGDGQLSWGYENTGRAVNEGEFKEYGKLFTEKDVVGAYVDLDSTPCTISYTLNGEELGVAYEFDKVLLGDRPLYPHILTKNICYKVNLGYEKYNLLTRTKVVRQRIEVPIEQVLEEKKAREAEIERLKEEANRRSRERREKERKEREDKQKKRDERDKASRERKEKDAEEKKEEVEEPEEERETQEEPEKADAEESTETKQENGDSDVKNEPMETDNAVVQESQTKEEEKTTSDKEEEKPEIKDEPTKDDGKEVIEDDFLKGLLLDKRMKNVIRYVVSEELDGAEASLLAGYVLVAQAQLLAGPRAPLAAADCEVILMVGMPGSGKTFWVKNHIAANPTKRYNILSTGALFDKMKVDCKPFRSSFEGRWDAMVTKSAKCVLKLLEVARGRKRNFILDQTNVYPSAQRRKLREFDGYRRVAVVVVTDEDTYKERQKRREEADGKE